MNPSTVLPLLRRHAHARVGSGKTDLVSSLPLDLLLQVLEYLDTADIVRSQRVSKQWRTIFSCEAVIRRTLSRTLEFLGLENKGVAIDDAMTYFRWEHGLQCFRPLKKWFIPWSLSGPGFKPVVYNTRQLSYDTWGSSVHVYNLETAETSRWSDEQVSAIHAFWQHFVSDRYLVLAWYNKYVTVWDMHSSKKQQREFPFAIRKIDVERDKVILFSSSSESDPLQPIHIWDLSADQIHAIGSFREGEAEVLLWHVDADENEFVTVQIDWDKHPPEVHQSKWTLTGQLLNSKHFHLSLIPEAIRFRPMWWNWRPSHRTFGHQTLSRLTSRMNDELTMVDLMYDHAKEKLSYRLVDYTLPVADYSYEHVTPYMTCYWNDALKCLDICNTANGTRRMLPYRLDIREVRTYEYLHKQSRQPEFDTDEDVLQLIGGPEVLCFASRDGIQLWFFNPNFVPDIDVPFARPFVAM